MNRISVTYNISSNVPAASDWASAPIVVFEPHCIERFSGFSLQYINCASDTITFTVQASFFQGGPFATIYTDSWWGTTSLDVLAGDNGLVYNQAIRDNPFKWVRILATASFVPSASNVSMILHGYNRREN